MTLEQAFFAQIFEAAIQKKMSDTLRGEEMATPMQCPSAYVDFASNAPLEEVAGALSRELFASIPFVGNNEGIWDETPAVRLSSRLLGLEVVLGGTEQGGYTLEASAADFPWETVAPNDVATTSVDLSRYFAFLLGKIPGIHVLRVGPLA